MTNHDSCSHPRTKTARATCRRHQADNVHGTDGGTTWVLVELVTGGKDRVTVVRDYSITHSSLVGMGYTCSRIVWGSDDEPICAFFQHKINDTMSARLELR